MGKKRTKRTKKFFDLLASIIAILCTIIIETIKLPFRIYKKVKKHNRKKPRASYQKAKLFRSDPEQIDNGTYRKRCLLTKNEFYFYHHLKPIAEELGFIILTKIRMADLVEPTASNNREYYSAFGKVKAKHVDFALVHPQTLYVELLIELDDSSHKPGNERDAFVEQVYRSTGYTLLRVTTVQNLREYILSVVAPNKVKPKESTEPKPQESSEEIYQSIMKHLEAPATEETYPTG